MSKKTRYKQCKLVKTEKAEGRSHVRVSWIPEKFAVVGKVLKLKENDVWIDGFVVEFAGEDAIDEPPDMNKAIRGHRKATGDSLPKEKS